MKINQKNLDEHIQETVANALKQFKEWNDPEDIFDVNSNEYVLMVETIASDDHGIYQPDKILPELEPLVVGLDKAIEDIQKGIAEEGEEYDEDDPPQISWEPDVIDLVEKASTIISNALNKHPVVKQVKLTFSFGSSEGSGDWGMFASMEPAAFKALRKSGKNKAANSASKTTMKPRKYYVVMTDRAMSGWGMAEKKINKIVIGVDDSKLADRIAENAKNRKDFKHINIRTTKPYYNKDRVYVSYHEPSKETAAAILAGDKRSIY